MAYLLLLIWIVVIIAESRVSGRIWSNFLGNAFAVLALPGIIIHEVSHLFGCLIMGAKVTNFSILESQGGYVAHSEPKVPIIGKPVIAFAPVFGCGFALLLVYYLFHGHSGPPTSGDAGNILKLEFTQAGFRTFAMAVYDVVKDFFLSLKKADFHSVWTYVFAYLALSIGIAFSPSKQDFGNAAISLLVCIVLLFIGDLVAVALNHPNGLEQYLIAPVVPALSFALGMMTMVLAISLVAWGLHKLIGVVMKPEAGGKGGKAGKGRKGSKSGKGVKDEQNGAE